MPWLATEGSAHQIGEGETIVGSGPHAAWRLASQDLAARHFLITRTGEQVTISAADMESVVAVNGRQIGTTPTPLRDGDMIDAGKARFAFSSQRRSGVTAIEVGPAHLVEVRSGIAHQLEGASIGIGRDLANAIVVRDPTASRFHAEIRREAGGWVLYPRGSTGTLINGKPVGAPERLASGDKIEIAHVEMQFMTGSAPAGAPRPAPLTGEEQDRSHRRTIMASAVMEVPDEATVSSRSNLWLLLVLGLVVVGTLYLAFR